MSIWPCKRMARLNYTSTPTSGAPTSAKSRLKAATPSWLTFSMERGFRKCLRSLKRSFKSLKRAPILKKNIRTLSKSFAAIVPWHTAIWLPGYRTTCLWRRSPATRSHCAASKRPWFSCLDMSTSMLEMKLWSCWICFMMNMTGRCKQLSSQLCAVWANTSKSNWM